MFNRIGLDGIEQYVSSPELHSENGIGQDPLPPGQAWAVGQGDQNEGSGLYKIEVTVTPGSSIRLINVKAPSGLREGLRAAEQVLYAQARSLIGDRDPMGSEFSVQVRALTAVKGASSLEMSFLLALCSAALGRSLKGGVIVAGGYECGGDRRTGLQCTGYGGISRGKRGVSNPASSIQPEATQRDIR